MRGASSGQLFLGCWIWAKSIEHSSRLVPRRRNNSMLQNSFLTNDLLHGDTNLGLSKPLFLRTGCLTEFAPTQWRWFRASFHECSCQLHANLNNMPLLWPRADPIVDISSWCQLFLNLSHALLSYRLSIARERQLGGHSTGASKLSRHWVQFY